LFAQTAEAHSPQILLTPQRLRRLKLDRQRQTMRWVNFENRVKTVPDSTERGFELALYYAITTDEARGRAAIAWAKDHRCDRRQVALVLDWTNELLSEDERRTLSDESCAAGLDSSPATYRDVLFSKVARNEDLEDFVAETRRLLPEWIEVRKLSDANDLYAACEILSVVRHTEGIDLRQGAKDVFKQLPAEFLLRLKPREMEHPGWMAHSAALALVDLDPNLESSQYLQGWALEDNQTVREGPGVAYELLWADPYLPGVSYRNMDPWMYQPGREFVARADWNTDTCWIDISQAGVQEDNCPAHWRDKSAPFGRLNLVPVSGTCVDVPARNSKQALMLWRLRPGQEFTYPNGEKTPALAEADTLGLWQVPSNVEGKVCLKREARTKEATR